MFLNRLFAAALFGVACLISPLAAVDAVTVGPLKIETAWTRATPPAAKTGGGYLTITNTGSDDDRLVSASTDIASMSQIHEMAVTDGVMKMRQLADGLAIPAGATVELKPGGYHVMMMGLKQPIKEGAMVEVTLTFAKAGSVTVTMPAAPIGAREPAMNHGGHG